MLEMVCMTFNYLFIYLFITIFRGPGCNANLISVCKYFYINESRIKLTYTTPAILSLPSNKVTRDGIINSKKLSCISNHLSQFSKGKKIHVICTNFYKVVANWQNIS